MIGDLVLIFIFVIIWQRILKLRKENFREFIFELSIYFFVFAITIIFYKFFLLALSYIFDFGLFPSIVGVFALNFMIIYLPIRFFVYYLTKKNKLTSEKREKIIRSEMKLIDFVLHSLEDFQKAFMIFFVINLIIIFTLLNSFVDVFTHQKILNYESNKNIDIRAEKLISNTKGSVQGRKNLAETIYFLKIVDPKVYEKIVENTNSFVFSSKSMMPVLAMAHMPDDYIEIDPIFTKPFNSLEDKIYFASILVHESEHLKNFRHDGGFAGNALNYALLSIKCNPLTNYQYFSDIRRSIFIFGDEWCAQVSEVKFFKQFNIDYKGDWIKNFKDN
ncbi:MAG: hypothetical protein KAI57_03640 [Candidatus Pacebacteria bacterium]|nr:hypothetical protein [Candidatus Paceibacterota bacterium]